MSHYYPQIKAMRVSMLSSQKPAAPPARAQSSPAVDTTGWTREQLLTYVAQGTLMIVTWTAFGLALAQYLLPN